MLRFPGHLTPRDRRALAALAVAAALFLLLQFAVLPWTDEAQKLRASLPLKEKTLRKSQQMVALAGAREWGWQSLQSRVADAEKRLLASRVPPVAAAEMQDLLKQLMSRQGIEMRGADFLPVRAVRLGAVTYTAVPLSLAFECTLDQLTNLLLAARDSGRALALDQLAVTAVPPRPDRPRKMLSVRLVIRGLMAAEQPPAPKS